MNYKNVIFLSIFILGIGCGVQANPDPEAIKIPEKISVEIPEVLNSTKDELNSSKQQKIKIDRVDGLATGYYSVKWYIVHLRDIVDEMKSNLFFANQVIVEIEKHCQETPVGKICTIPANTLSFVIDKEMIAYLRLIIPDNFTHGNPDNLIGERVFFGVIEFIHHDENSSYQYSLNMDMSDINGKIGFYDRRDLPTIIQAINWSEDKNRIFSSLTKKDKNGANFPWTLHYYNQPNIEETMHLYDKKDSVDSSSSRIFTLTSRDDKEKSSTVHLNSIKETVSSRVALDRLSSSIELSNKGGFQKFTQTQSFGNSYSKVNRDEVFNKDGGLLATTYCDDSSSECSLYDRSTWYSDSDDESIFAPLANMGFEELKIINGNLLDGEYFLLPMEYSIINMSTQKMLELSVGEFTVLKGVRQGVLYDVRYREKLDKLQLIYARYNSELDVLLSNKSDKLFEVVADKNLPEIGLWSSER